MLSFLGIGPYCLRKLIQPELFVDILIPLLSLYSLSNISFTLILSYLSKPYLTIERKNFSIKEKFIIENKNIKS